MRSQWRFVGLLLLLAVVGGCDTTAPLQIEEQTYELEIVGTSVGPIPVYEVYDMYEEGVGEYFLFCETDVGFLLTPSSAPWNFSIQIEILRAGETEPEIITSGGALDPDVNLTLYDQNPAIIGGLGDKDSITIGEAPNTRTFHFENPRRLTVASEEVMMATTNPLSEALPDTYGLGAGLCSNAYPGPASLDGMPHPISIVLNKGDTLLIQARKSDTSPAGVWFLPNEAAIRGDLLLDGNTVSVRGQNSSSTATGAGFSFSFTSL
jgi:hypothetical protein